MYVFEKDANTHVLSGSLNIIYIIVLGNNEYNNHQHCTEHITYYCTFGYFHGFKIPWLRKV